MEKKVNFKKIRKLQNIAPSRIIVFSFAIVIFLGSILLSLPISSKSGESLGFFNSIFTSTSATCVTGLTLYDTYENYTFFGQIIILILIQMGGLGIVTLATFFSIIIGKKVGLKGMILAKESVNNFNFPDVLSLIKKIVIVTISIELFGALLLSLKLVPIFGVKGFYYGLFHSVSAFCNAGFDIMGPVDQSSLSNYFNDSLVLLTISSLTIIGGLGFVVWRDFYEFKKRKNVYLHTKIVLVISIILIIIGTIFILNFEFYNSKTIGSMNTGNKILNAYFMSISSRTAGFSTFNIHDLSEISKVFMVVLMFIGASSGSTGGGVKTSTFGIMIFAIISQIKGSESTIIFKRKIPYSIVTKALTISGLSMILIISITTLILVIEPNPFIDVLFLTTSAFGTVGLSPLPLNELGLFSKTLIIVTMFLGRVGPMTFGIALSLKSYKRKSAVYPEGKVLVG
ncbi:MAG: TrkH family potassium uptake protein [Clostridiales bacterium]